MLSQLRDLWFWCGQLHEQDEVLSMWGPDIPPVSPRTATFHFLIAVTGFVGFGLLVKHIIAQEPPAVRREYPFSGLVQELGGLDTNKVCICVGYLMIFLSLFCRRARNRRRLRKIISTVLVRILGGKISIRNFENAELLPPISFD